MVSARVADNDDGNDDSGGACYDLHIIDAARLALQIINEIKEITGGDINEHTLMSIHDSHIIHVAIKPTAH